MHNKLIFLAFLVAISILIWSFVIQIQSRKFSVHFLNVGQGDSILIETNNGKQVLIDGGPSRSVLRELGNLMSFWDRSIDIVIATHLDKDHISGLIDVLKKYKVEKVIYPNSNADTSYAQEFLKLAKGEGENIIADRGMSISLDNKTKLEILFPLSNIVLSDKNESSVFAKLIHSQNSFLLTGDSTVGVEKYLISMGDDLKAGVLKAGHHGSKTSTSKDFVEEVNPDFVVISAGENNRYDHPHSQVLNNVEGTEVLYTWDGAISFGVCGEGLCFEQ